MQKSLTFNFASFFVCFLFANTLNALPVYKNYQNTDIFTTKLKIGYFIGDHYIDEYRLNFQSQGLNCAMEFNPFYATNLLHNLFVGLNAYVIPKGKIKSNNLLFTLSYYVPLNIITPDWIPKLDLYANCGYAIRFTQIKEKLDIDNLYINKYGNAPVIGFGAELTYRTLQNYGISCYVDYKFMWFDIKSNVYNIKKYKQYENIFVTIGIVYKSNFFTKTNTIN